MRPQFYVMFFGWKTMNDTLGHNTHFCQKIHFILGFFGNVIFCGKWVSRIVNFCPCVWWDLFSSHSRFLLYVCYLFSLESQTRVGERDVTFLGLSQTEEEKRILHGYGATPFPHQEIIELDFNCCRVVAQLVHLHTLHNFELIS